MKPIFKVHEKIFLLAMLGMFTLEQTLPNPQAGSLISPFVEEISKTISIAYGCQYIYTALFSILEFIIYVVSYYSKLWFGEFTVPTMLQLKYTMIPARMFCIGTHFVFLATQLLVLKIVRRKAEKFSGRKKKVVLGLGWYSAALVGGYVHLIYNEGLSHYILKIFLI
ncbi:MAG: hypothetical protein PVG65_00845 [Candidatus Thorarchaeota archaeon]|jgi:hypothetical protein